MKTALILVDIQNDFLPGGALAVPEGDAVIPVANALMPHFDLVIRTQDWHPETHLSFAKNHSLPIGEIIELDGLTQVLWPVHCVQNSKGAEFAKTLDSHPNTLVFTKGENVEIDSYSGFFDNGHRHDTGLEKFLKKQGVESVFVMGLATDYCVKYTVFDAIKVGLTTHLIRDGVRGVNLNDGDARRAIEEMENAGAKILNSDEIISKEVYHV